MEIIKTKLNKEDWEKILSESNMMLKINLREYFRDFKKGYYIWKKEVNDVNNYEKAIGVMYISGYKFPPQGGLGKFETTEGDYTIKGK